MRLLVLAPAFLFLPATTSAQSPRVYSAPRAGALRIGDDSPRAVIGVSTSGSTSPRDTLGLLVTSVTPNSPADKAGIQEGDRLATVNGVNLRISSADVGDFEVSSAMSRRLTRELSKLRPGDDVDLRLYSEGRTRTVHLRTADSDSLYSSRRLTRSEIDDRATLGFGLAATNSRRDTLGVLVMFVDDSGPAARAGIEEGNRIAAIDDIDLRVGRDDSGDDFIGTSKVRRLQREVQRLHPGDNVDLRIYANGEFRTIRLRAVRAAELPRRHRTFMIGGDGIGMMPPALPFNIDGALIGEQVRSAIERAMDGAGRALEGVGRGLERSRLMWQDDDDAAPRPPRVEPIEPIHIEPLEPSRLRRVAPMKAPITSAMLDDSAFGAPMVAAALAPGTLRKRTSAVSLDIAGLRMVPVGSELASYLGSGSERGLLVLDVPAWARDAVRPGDVVLSVDGTPVRSNDGADDVTVAIPRFREAQLDILRDGVHHSVTLPARR